MPVLPRHNHPILGLIYRQSQDATLPFPLLQQLPFAAPPPNVAHPIATHHRLMSHVEILRFLFGFEFGDDAATPDVILEDFFVFAHGEVGVTIRGEQAFCDGVAVVFRAVVWPLLGADVPQLDRLVVRTGAEQGFVGVPTHRVYGVCVPAETPLHLHLFLEVEDQDDFVFGAASQLGLPRAQGYIQYALNFGIPRLIINLLQILGDHINPRKLPLPIGNHNPLAILIRRQPTQPPRQLLIEKLDNPRLTRVNEIDIASIGPAIAHDHLLRALQICHLLDEAVLFSILLVVFEAVHEVGEEGFAGGVYRLWVGETEDAVQVCEAVEAVVQVFALGVVRQ